MVFHLTKVDYYTIVIVAGNEDFHASSSSVSVVNSDIKSTAGPATGKYKCLALQLIILHCR